MDRSTRILILSFSPIARDPRVMRQVRLLESRARLTVAGYGPAPPADVHYVCLDQPKVNRRILLQWETQLIFGMSDSYYWSRSDTQQALHALEGQKYDLVIANDIAALPAGLSIAGHAPVLIDAHEFSPGELSDSLVWRLRFGRHYESLCKRYLPRAAAMTTVCAGIEEEYRSRYGATGTVIENAPLRQDLEPNPVQAGRIRLIHHGIASRARRLDLMIDMMNDLDKRFTLDFMLVPGDVEYLQELREYAQNIPRVSFIAPVDMPAICRRLNDYDIGVFLLPPVNLNYRLALPNKLFEFIQARLAIAIGPSPEMARVVREHGLGVVADSFDPASLARELNALSEEDVMRYKEASHAASGQLCFETAAGRLLALIEQLVSRSRDREQAFA